METYVQKKQNANGEFILGFRIDPPEKLESVTKELLALHRVFSESPIFGVEYSIEAEAAAAAETAAATATSKVEDDVDLLDDDGEDVHAVAAYYLEAGNEQSLARDHEGHDQIIYDPRLGLAVEALPEDITLDQLWRVV